LGYERRFARVVSVFGEEVVEEQTDEIA